MKHIEGNAIPAFTDLPPSRQPEMTARVSSHHNVKELDMSESADNSHASTDNITAGFKRDIDRCIRADRRLTSSEKIVAEAIVDFMNAKTGATFPSDQAITDRTGLSNQIVLRARANLKKNGWLDWDIIPGLANHYRVLTGNRKAIEAEQDALDEARKQARKRPDDTSVSDDTPITNDRGSPSPVTDTPITSDRGPPSPVIGDPYHGRQGNPLHEPTERTHGERVSSPSQSDFSANGKTAGKEPAQPEASPGRSSKKESPAPPPKKERFRPARFAEFWAAYPRKEDKKAAENAYALAVRNRSATEEELIAGAMRFAAERANENPKYTKYATTWLKGECWQNSSAPKPPVNGFNGSSSGPRRSYNDSILAGLAKAAGVDQ
jgi:hypothetical protein